MISLLITTFKRTHLLRHTIPSILRQKVSQELEVIVINDGPPDGAEELCKEHGIRYIYTGHRNKDSLYWRVPGFALNIGARKAGGDILIISCAEMFHLGDCINSMVAPFQTRKGLMVSPELKNDTGAKALAALQSGATDADLWKVENLSGMKDSLPFLMAVSRSVYFKIGGYDEDLTGMAFDDDDFVHRMTLAGCQFIQAPARGIHLFHERVYPWGGDTSKQRERFLFNQSLFKARMGKMVRNQDHVWGKMP